MVPTSFFLWSGTQLKRWRTGQVVPGRQGSMRVHNWAPLYLMPITLLAICCSFSISTVFWGEV